MTNYRRITLGSELGSVELEQRMTEIALLTRKAFPEYKWEVAKDGGRGHPYCLLVHLAGREMPVNFTYRELVTYSRLRRRYALDHRMHDALNKLFES